MSKRLQVVLAEQEMLEIQRAARSECLGVSAWVRRALRVALAERVAIKAESKLNAIRRAASYSFSTLDAGPVSSEIERRKR